MQRFFLSVNSLSFESLQLLVVLFRLHGFRASSEELSFHVDLFQLFRESLFLLIARLLLLPYPFGDLHCGLFRNFLLHQFCLSLLFLQFGVALRSLSAGNGSDLGQILRLRQKDFVFLALRVSRIDEANEGSAPELVLAVMHRSVQPADRREVGDGWRTMGIKLV